MTDTQITIGLVFIAVLALLVLSFTHREPAARIGGTEVPALRCEEDEVIAFDSTRPAPYPLSCVHIDALDA